METPENITTPEDLNIRDNSPNKNDKGLFNGDKLVLVQIGSTLFKLSLYGKIDRPIKEIIGMLDHEAFDIRLLKDKE